MTITMNITIVLYVMLCDLAEILMASWGNLLPPSSEFYPLKQWYIPTRLHDVTLNKEVTFRHNEVFTIPQKHNNCNQHTLIVPPHAEKKLNGYGSLQMQFHWHTYCPYGFYNNCFYLSLCHYPATKASQYVIFKAFIAN